MKLKRYACIWDRVDVSSLCVWTQERYDTMEWSERIWVTKPLVQLKDKSKAASIWDGMSKWFRVLVSLLFNHKLCMCLSWREEKEARKSCISKLYKGKLKKHVKFKAVHFVDFNGLMVPLKLNISFEAIQCMYICFYGPYLLLSSWASLCFGQTPSRIQQSCLSISLDFCIHYRVEEARLCSLSPFVYPYVS